MITAIILDERSQKRAISEAALLGEIRAGAKVFCHHVTLKLGDCNGYTLGAERRLVATHVGRIDGRVVAFKVEGADDSKNPVPHVTIATFDGAKPAESNLIESWAVISPFELTGKIAVFE